MKKIIILLVLVLTSIKGRAQYHPQIGLWVGRDLQETHIGSSFSLNKKLSWTWSMGLGYTSKETGDYKGAVNNSGVYQIGAWGNNLTGRKETYYNEYDNTNYNVGVLFSISEDNKSKLYIAVGKFSRKKTNIVQYQAEDISSGYNVLGYYWVKGDGSYYKISNATNISVGIMVDISDNMTQFGGIGTTVGAFTSYNGISGMTIQATLGIFGF
jgi:hypothetical protein